MLKKYWDDKERRKGIIGTLAFHLALVFLFLFLGLKYYDPPPSNGIVINFGNSETGKGNQNDGAQQVTPARPKSQPKQQIVESTQDAQDPIQTQDVTDAPPVNTQASQKVESTETTEVVEPEETKPDTRKLDDLFQTTTDSKEGGSGDKEGPGDQGKPEGDPSSPNQTGGAGGNGGTGNYMLGGRKALSKPKPKYECDDEGRVVVKIYVDRNGKVTQAIPGAKIPNGAASTTTSKCLYDKAKAAAMKTTWQADRDAQSTQKGYIIYNFYKS